MLIYLKHTSCIWNIFLVSLPLFWNLSSSVGTKDCPTAACQVFLVPSPILVLSTMRLLTHLVPSVYLWPIFLLELKRYECNWIENMSILLTVSICHQNSGFFCSLTYSWATCHLPLFWCHLPTSSGHLPYLPGLFISLLFHVAMSMTIVQYTLHWIVFFYRKIFTASVIELDPN